MPGKPLTPTERGQIQALHAEGNTFPQIAQKIGRHRTTIWREISTHHSYRKQNPNHTYAKNPKGASNTNRQGLKGPYRWYYSDTVAHQKALKKRSHRGRKPKLTPAGYNQPMPPLWDHIITRLKKQYSPAQISADPKRCFPDDKSMHVSHETIYKAIYLQPRGLLRQELTRQLALRTGRTRRKPQGRVPKTGRGAKPWTHDWNISTRPAEAKDRAVPGHWEGDLVIGARGSSAIITLVERSTRFVVLGALPQGRASEQVVQRLVELMGQVPVELRRSLTWDQGAELAQVADFRLATDVDVYFADPRSPWQRGSNENTNGLLRQYFPKGSTDFRLVSQERLDEVAGLLNGRPRLTLGWDSPAQRLAVLLGGGVAGFS